MFFCFLNHVCANLMHVLEFRLPNGCVRNHMWSVLFLNNKNIYSLGINEVSLSRPIY